MRNSTSQFDSYYPLCDLRPFFLTSVQRAGTRSVADAVHPYGIQHAVFGTDRLKPDALRRFNSAAVLTHDPFEIRLRQPYSTMRPKRLVYHCQGLYHTIDHSSPRVGLCLYYASLSHRCKIKVSFLLPPLPPPIPALENQSSLNHSLPPSHYRGKTKARFILLHPLPPNLPFPAPSPFAQSSTSSKVLGFDRKWPGSIPLE